MRNLMFGGLIALSGCAALSSVPVAPAAVANRTVLDEQVGQGVELAYKAFRMAQEFRVDSGKLHGDAAARVAVLDSKAYGLVLTMRAAYAAGNADTYAGAAKQARAVIAAALAAVKGQ